MRQWVEHQIDVCVSLSLSLPLSPLSLFSVFLSLSNQFWKKEKDQPVRQVETQGNWHSRGQVKKARTSQKEGSPLCQMVFRFK